MLSPLVLSGALLGNVLPRIHEDGLPGAHYHGISTEYAVCQLSFRGAILASKRSLTLTTDILMQIRTEFAPSVQSVDFPLRDPF